MRRRKQIKLSQFLNGKTRIENKQFTAEGIGITEIDQIDAFVCSQIETLNLHNNKLTSLQGLSQFNFIKQLDLSSNRISNCQELAVLLQMYQLRKLYLNNNPFLDEPIDQRIFQFIIDKETDIEILSFQLLNSIKQLQEEEIKIIFLKNYLSKIDLHEELRNKKRINKLTQKMETSQLVSKIIPQFYTIIQDPKLAYKIKKEAFEAKKKSKDNIQSILKQTKQVKQQQINSLIKEVVYLLQDSQQFKNSNSFLLEVNFNENTITFSPQKNKKGFNNIILDQSEQFSPVKHIQVSKEEISIEEITLTNNRQFSTVKADYQNIPKERHILIDDEMDNIETARNRTKEKSLSDKIKHHSQYKKNYQLQLKKIKEKQENTVQRYNKSECSQPQLSKAMTPIKNKPTTPKQEKTTGIRKTPNNNQYIKVIQQNQDESQSIKNSRQFKQLIHKPVINLQPIISPRNFQSSSISWRSQMNEQLTPDMIDTIYYKTLAKINPMFSLLLSPANSLNNQEKNTIIQALKIDHKQKFIELMKERVKNQHLMRQLENVKEQQNIKIQEIVNNNKRVYDQYLLYKEQFQWIQQRQRATEENNQELILRIRELQAIDKKKSISLAVIENNYKKIKDSYVEKNAELNHLQKAEENEVKMQQKHQLIIKNKYLKLLKNRGFIWSEVLRRNKSCNRRRQMILLQWGVESFMFNRNESRAVRQMIKKQDYRITMNNFNEWKAYKQLSIKERKIDKLVFGKRSHEIMKILKSNEASHKMKKLKEIWAQRFLKQKRYNKVFNNWTKLRQQFLFHKQKSVSHWIFHMQSQYFYSIKMLIQTRKDNIFKINDNRKSRLLQSQFKRMLYIMRKQKSQIDFKEKQLERQREKQKRTIYLKRFKEYAGRRKNSKKNQKLLRKYLLAKRFAVFKSFWLRMQKKMSKFKKHYRLIKRKLTIKMLKRQKLQNDFEIRLNNRKQAKFYKHLKEYFKIRKDHNHKYDKLSIYKNQQLLTKKLQFIKNMHILKLKGKYYIKKRTIQQMNLQMQLNQQNALDIVKKEQEQIGKCQMEISFYKAQIQNQSIRQIILLRQKDQMLLSINQSYEIMMQLRREVDLIREESAEQQKKYKNLVGLYNQSLTMLKKKEKEYEWLHDTLRDYKMK